MQNYEDVIQEQAEIKVNYQLIQLVHFQLAQKFEIKFTQV